MSRPNRPAMALMVSPRAMVYSAGAATCAGRNAEGTVAGTEPEGMSAGASPVAAWAWAWAWMAAASVAGRARGASAEAGSAIAREESTTAGRAAVVAASIGRLGLGLGFGERNVVMGKILFSAADAAGLAWGHAVIKLLLLLL